MSAGEDGLLAALLFKAQKASKRAKRYRGGTETAAGYRSFRDMSYERKSDTLMRLAEFLEESGGESWGWGRDEAAGQNPWVLYVELPQGQVSFHSPHRGPGRDYGDKWDGQKVSEERILAFCEDVLRLGAHEVKHGSDND